MRCPRLATPGVPYWTDLRLGFRERDQLGDGFRGKGRICEEHIGADRDARNEREVLERVVAELRIQARARSERDAAARRDRVAVGIAAGGDLDADVAARARPVVDDHRLAEALRDAPRDHATDEIVAAAGCEADDQPDRLHGIVFGSSGERERWDQQRADRDDAAKHGVLRSTRVKLHCNARSRLGELRSGACRNQWRMR